MKVKDIYAEIEVTLNVFCECGALLFGEFERGKIQVEPCEQCMTKEYDKAYNSGFDSGYETGVKDEQNAD